MNSKKLALVATLAIFTLSVIALPGLGQAQQPKQDKGNLYIPKDVKALLEQGLAAKQGLPDIAVTVSGHYFFPYYRVPGLMHNVFELKLKNADLGFAPVQGAAAAAAPAKPEEKKETAEAFEEVPATDMTAQFDLFLQFRELTNNVPGKIVKEVFVPSDFVIPADEYKPDAEEAYYVGYDLAPGTYLLAMAVQSKNQKKIGTAYFEFTTPDWIKLENKLETSPIIVAKEVSQMQAQETQTNLHRGFFTYLVLKVSPNIDRAIPAKAPLDLLYFVMGAKPNDQGRFALETEMEVKQADKTMIKYSSTVYDSPFTSIPLPMKQTLKRTIGTNVTTEVKDLPIGKYTLYLNIVDKTDGINEDIFKNIKDRISVGVGEEGKAPTVNDKLVDINKAELEDLKNLPGITTNIAKNIIAARPIRTVDDSKKIGRAYFTKNIEFEIVEKSENKLPYLDLHSVVYKVTGNGTNQASTITFQNAQGDSSQEANVKLPWTRSFRFSKGSYVYISAQNANDSGDITTEIWIDDVLYKNNTSRGAHVIATCSGSIEK